MTVSIAKLAAVAATTATVAAATPDLSGNRDTRPVRRPHTVQGAKFRAASFFRATQMSEAMAKAGIIPGTHLVSEQAKVAISGARRQAL